MQARRTLVYHFSRFFRRNPVLAIAFAGHSGTALDAGLDAAASAFWA
jgi:hypothetical protein